MTGLTVPTPVPQGGRERTVTQYIVVPADLRSDADAIVGVWSRNLSSNTAEEHRAKLAWNYLDNPAGAGRVWLLRAGPAGPAVGTVGLGLRWLAVGGERVLVGVNSDYAVDKEHRSLLPAMMLQRSVLACLGDDLPLIYGMPNAKASGIIERLGYKPVRTSGRSVRLLRVGRYLKARRGLLRAMMPLVPVLNLGLRAVSAHTWRWSRGRAVRELPAFDRRFDDLWHRAVANLPVAGERTSDFLNWRFAACPLRRYRTIGLLAGGGEQLLGYAVCYLRDDQAVVADFLTDESNRAADDLVAGVLAWARREGVSSVAAEWSLPQLAPSLRRFGFVERAEERSLELRAVSVPRLAPAPLADWYVTPGDEDYN